MTPLDLLGTWDLQRVVEDRLAGERRDVSGSATLTSDGPDRVRWSEAGTMTWAGRSVPVERTLYVVRGDGSWAVEFSDGRPFHPWAVEERVTHPCAPDSYDGLIRVVGHPVEQWSVEWRATGPEKDYVMTTVHSGRRPPHRS